MPFARKRRKKLGKNISKHLSSKYIQKPLDYAKQSATDAVKAVTKRAIEENRDLIDNKLAHKITRMWKILPQNSSETVQKEDIGFDRELLIERTYLYKKGSKLLMIQN